MTCSIYNLVAITIFHYLEIIHPLSNLSKWWKKWPSVAVLSPWIIGITYDMYLDVFHAAIINNVCYAVSLWSSKSEFKGAMVSLVVSHTAPILVFCVAFPRMSRRLSKPVVSFRLVR